MRVEAKNYGHFAGKGVDVFFGNNDSCYLSIITGEDSNAGTGEYEIAILGMEDAVTREKPFHTKTVWSYLFGEELFDDVAVVSKDILKTVIEYLEVNYTKVIFS